MKVKYLTLFACIMMMLIGCKGMEQYSPEQVMKNAIAAESEEASYYGEQTITMTDPEETFEMYVKEWRSGDKSLEEVTADGEVMVTLVEGRNISTYDPQANTLMETEFDNPDELHFSSKERVEELLDSIRDTHSIERKAEEKIAGRETIHLVAEKNKGEKSLYGRQEMWIDKENWLLLKTIFNTGDSKITIEYTTLEMEPKMDDTVFQLDVPDDVMIETFDDVIEEKITLEDGIKRLGSPFMYFKDQDGLILEEITTYEIADDPMIELTYNFDGLPYMDLSVMLIEEDMVGEEDFEEDEIAEAISIRGKEGEYIDFDDMKMLTWEEGLFAYTITFINPNMTLEEVKALVNEMEEVSTEKEGVE